MALNPPNKGKPRDPRDEKQRDRETITMVAFPEIGKWNKKKLVPGALHGRVQKVGKK